MVVGVYDREKEEKICPLTGKLVDDSLAYRSYCLFDDCSHVDEDKRYYLHGHAYHCRKEKDLIEKWYEDLLKDAEKYRKLNMSLDIARKIDIDSFFAYCDNLDEIMVKGKQRYNKDMLINPYHGPDEKCLIYLFEDDNVIEISVTENPFSFIGIRRFDRLKNGGDRSAINICAVPAYLADAINVRLHLQYKMDVKSILHDDNPVYIKKKKVGGYINAVYGWDWVTFKKALDMHLEMTEILNYDNILYIKQELDDIVRSENKIIE